MTSLPLDTCQMVMEKQELSRLIGSVCVVGRARFSHRKISKVQDPVCYIFQVVKWAINSLQVPAMTIEMFDLGVLMMKYSV